MQQVLKRTKIVCTLGPATETIPAIVSLGLAGMDVARFNFSHGSHEWHGRVLKRVRQAEGRVGRPISILQDVHGRKIRVGDLPAKGIPLRAGHEIVFTTDPSPMPGDVPVPFTGLEHMVKSRGHHGRHAPAT
jgi:pyruvate kinase